MPERINSHEQRIERMHQQHAERVESIRRQLRAPRESAHPITESGVSSLSGLLSTITTMMSTSERRSGEPETTQEGLDSEPETSQERSDSEPSKPSPQPDMDRTELWFMGIDVDVPHFRCVQHNHTGYREFLRRTGSKVVHYEVQDVLRGISEAFVALREARSDLDPGWHSGDAGVSVWNLRLSRCVRLS
jgi:hypothetical protein